ncbi:terminase large subunit [Caldicoprobacter algeriensis]|uniref:terminase large subunit n=1 Tax=Caldicoprobacter algeriensis TaxID=699281 RepID=UPI002079AABD|nr:terminase TerL endonuclease subunit [Caldicoprobacter algeriensis]MCM8900609.1 terminase large subunit [Caldicoprobacter algeriensis]
MTNYILEYWNKIQSGEIAACKRLKQQFQKLVEELENPRDPWVFDLEKANQPIEFIETFCKHSKGKWAGKPVKLELFQKAIIQAIYGFVHKETGLRRCREVFILLGRKNGKTTMLSALGLYMLVGDGEGGAEVFSIATKKDQARLVFTEACNMVSQSPALRKHLKKRKTDLYFPVTFSKFEPLASESNSLDGLNSHCVIMDELHAIKDRNLYDVMKQSMTAREQPILFMITTAGFVRECIFDDIYSYACKVLDGLIEDERFLAFIYELDDRSEWTDFRAWEKANPGLGTIKNYEELAAFVERAKDDPNFLPTVLTKDFNIRETVAGSWLTFEQINNEETFDIEELRNTYAVGGVDLSSTTDLTCATLLIMKPGSDKKYCIQRYFLPEEGLEEKVTEDKIPYDKWRERDLLTVTPGNKVDYHMVTEWFLKMMNEYDITPLWIGYDPWNAKYWVQEMEGYGFQMIEVRQGYQTLSQPMKELEADLKAHKINYNNNPILKWCLTNVQVKRDENDNIKPVKGQNKGQRNRQRIDGAVSLLIAYTVLFNHLQDYMAMI